MSHEFENKSKSDWTVVFVPNPDEDDEDAPKPRKKKDVKGDPKLLYASLEVLENGRQVGVVKTPGSSVKLQPRHKYVFWYHMPENKKVTKGTDSLAMSLGFQDQDGNVFPFGGSVFNFGQNTLKSVAGFPGMNKSPSFTFEPRTRDASYRSRIRQALGSDLKDLWKLMSMVLGPAVDGPSLVKYGPGDAKREDKDSMGLITITSDSLR